MRMARRRVLQGSSSIAAIGAGVGSFRVSAAEQASGRPEAGKLSFDVRDFDAKGDGAMNDTAAIQRTIDRCSTFGGGDVLIPAGKYLTGAIALRSG